jgi:hypothetical protein
MANSTLHCPEPPQRATPPSSHEAQGEGLDQDFEEAKMTNLKKTIYDVAIIIMTC